ncbi:MAG: hypothetical protein F4Y99_04985 [Acidimicrobiaceae bacterium]|nr:hypothetical protein [Acidimicrobiaceae bacterium]MDE0514723.1 hypothetical protein [Acidimicrobiaceae bacterium]MDE0656337.1 hypothetical protein [Acidimicrobiaceae bacterium]MXZ95266.1 hypothetical protein [Acidimicrobiaceae bacterium]MYF43738.1 hypothetical protein [Acidimicrobiaceae bacterium]
MPAAFRDRFRRGSADTGSEPFPSDPADQDPDQDPGDGEAGEWLAYELHEWSLESRVMLQQLLTVDKVVHSWQGTTLMVHESLEEKVDSLVDEVEETEKAKEATSRPIGPEDSLTAFELAEWSEALRSELVERLVQARVPHILDTEGDATEGDATEGDATEGDADQETEPTEVCDLLVREADEDRVELVIDDLLAREEEAQFEELDGLEVNTLLSDLFVACDRLRKDPGDLDGIRGVVTNARRIAGVRTPFGFSAPNWRTLRNTVGELLDLVESEDADRDDLRELAHRMSDTLRTLV